MPSYRTLPSGKVQAIVRRTGHPPQQKTFPTKTLAKIWAERVDAELLLQLAKGARAETSPTLSEIIDWYIGKARQMGKLGQTSMGNLRRLKEGLGDIRADALSADHIVEHVKRRRNGEHVNSEGFRMPPCSAATMSVELTHLSQVIRLVRALKYAEIAREPLNDAREVLNQFRLVGKSNQRERRPTADELARLHARFEANRWRSKLPMSDLIRFAIGSTRRDAEICRLRWEDLDHDNRTLLVRDVKHPRKKKGNHKRFPLLGDMFDLVMAQPKTGPLIFPYKPSSISTSFTRACSALGIEDLQFHDLRHEGTSRLFEAGYGIEQVALVTLHEDWKQLKRYTHLRPESLHRDQLPTADAVPMK